MAKRCTVEGCGQPSRKCGWCASHYTQQYRSGKPPVPFLYKWATEPTCLFCDKPNGGFRSRKFCSAACERIYRRHDGRPLNPSCVLCGIEIDLTIVGKGGKRKKFDTKLCRRCRQHTRTALTPGQCAVRDGPYCQLCGCDVDMLARFPDKMRPSVDHIIPRAWGGSDAAENNGLTHLICNQIKSDRYQSMSSRTLL